jgi:ABC-type transport system substrate-binding protein/serine/threonine protein kinase/DNA-binding SARP family transcriptional activator
MAQLSVILLGPYQAMLNGEPVTGFDSDKVRALLAYLALEIDQPHRRQKLVGLLWPDFPERSARTNLRSALANLRQVIGDRQQDPPFLLISRQSIQFNQTSNFTLDVHEFNDLLEVGADHPSSSEKFEKAVKLYRGSFLDGFSIPDSIPFEEWLVTNREALQIKVSRALHFLTEYYESLADYDQALILAQQHLAIDPYIEETHRQIMRILVRSGQRSKALAQYDVCRDILKNDLKIEPQEDTTHLYRSIKENQELPSLEEPTLPLYTSQKATLKNRYVLGDELSHGSLGVVRCAYDNQKDREVAVKVIPAARLSSKERTAWMQELTNTMKLNHPNIVTIYETEESDESVYMVMERVIGNSLAELMRSEDRTLQSVERILEVARQICSALDHAHAYGIIHRDLKPENILIEPNGNVVVVGFEMTYHVSAHINVEDGMLSSAYYRAPELALGQDHDGRVDLYALGAILYEFTTGQPPFTGDNPMAVISQHLHASIVPPRVKNADIPPALDALVLRLLSKNPSHRPDSAADVMRILDAPDTLNMETVPGEKISVLKRIGRGRLVGRKRELQESSLMWNRTLSHQRQVLLISGEAGVGKTRLVREIVTRSEVFGGRALISACYGKGSTPYAPFRQIIRDVFRSGSLIPVEYELKPPESVFSDLLILAPELSNRFPDISEKPSQEPQIELQRMFESLTIFFIAVSELVPLLIVVEDLQWADSGTLSLLRHLALHTRRERIMLLLTCRDVEPEEAPFLHELLLDLTRERIASQLRLPRLICEETEELLSILFAEEITPEFLEIIYRHTEGNPFFIEEVCKTLVESGKVYYADGHWHRPSEIGELEIPDSIRVAIQSRVRVLPKCAQEILNLAAVIGREFDLNTLVSASDLDEDVLRDALEDALGAQIIEEISSDAGGTFAFVHNLIPTTLIEGLRSLQRRQIHHQVAITIEAQRPDDFEALAHHFSQARESSKAVDFLLKAGDRARRLFAHQNAICYYLEALVFLKKTGDLERAARTQMKLGLTYHNAFNFDASRRAYQEGFTFWQQAADLKRLASESIPSAPHPLRVSFFEPETLNLGVSMDFPSHIFLDQIFSGLAEVSSEMAVVPDVARSWEVFDGGRKYVFHLRNDVRWSDGKPVTAHDFEFTYKYNLGSAGGSLWSPFLYDIKNATAYHEGQVTDPNLIGVQALDDYTLVVEMEGPTSFFPYILAFIAGYPMPKHVVEMYGEHWAKLGNIVTNGPFRLVSWDKGESIILERNPSYHGSFTGNTETIECSFLSAQPTKNIQMYTEDKLDICGGLPLVEISNVRQHFADEYASGPWLSTDFIGFDLSRPPFNDLKIRRALALATDREMLADVILRGFAFPATGGFLSPGMPGHSPGIGLPYDPEQARNLMQEAGYPGGQGFPPFDCLVRDDPGHALACEYLQTQWLENLGVKFSWKLVEWGGYYQRFYEVEPSTWMAGWYADYPDPDDILRVNWWISMGGWDNQAYNKLVEDARRVMDQGDRIRMYQQADRIIVEEVPVLPLCYGRFHMLVKPWVKNLFISPLKWWSWKDIIIEPH